MDFRFSERMSGLSGSAVREILKLTSRPEIISFAGGLPATNCLPKKEILEIINEILSGPDAVAALQYGATEGFVQLREQVIEYVKSTGIENAAMDEVQILSGGQQGIDLMAKAFVDKGDVVLVENPTYLTALQIFASYQAKIVGVESDDNGLVLSDLENKIKQYNPKMLYIVPTFSNPTGKTYTVENRKGIAEITHKYNVMVLEDDPYSKLRFEGTPVPAIKSFDKGGNVVYVTSFSKVAAPGLRTGAAVGNKDVIRKLTIGKQGSDVTTVNLSQLAIAQYIKKGYLAENIKRSLPVYLERKTAMMAAIKKYMPTEYKHTNPDGGLFIWGNIKGLDMPSLMPRAIERNVAYIHGTPFFADGSGLDTFRLNFSNADPERIDRGIKVLGELFKDELSKK